MAAEARKKLIKAAPFIAAGAAAGLAAAGAAYFNTDVSADEQTARYREYTVSRGDITVGTQESGTLSMDREYVTFPCPGEVLETAVKEGQTVTEGDVLFRISPEDIDEYAAELKTEADNAEADLRSAEQKRESGIRTAEQTLETSLKKGEDAQNEYDLSNERQASDRSQSEYQLEKYRSELTETNALIESYPGDRAALDEQETKLENLESEREELSDRYEASHEKDEENSRALEELKSEYSEYQENTSESSDTINELKNDYEQAEERYNTAVSEYERIKEETENTAQTAVSETASDNSTSQTDTQKQSSKTLPQAQSEMNEAYSAYNSAKLAYLPYEKREQKIKDTKESYEEKIKQLEKDSKAHESETSDLKKELDKKDKEIDSFRTELQEKQEDFKGTYGQNDLDSLTERREELERSISQLELEIAETTAGEGEKQLEARQRLDSAVYEAQTAREVYDSSVAALDREVEQCRKKYEQAQESYEEFLGNTENGGVVYAPCSGIISSVSIEEGDDIAAGMPLVTIMDMNDIYMTTSVSEEDITSVYDGQDCSVTLTAYENRSFEGYVYTVSPEPARSSGSVSYTVTVKLTADDLNVREGMSGEISFLEGQAQDVLMLNVNAVCFRDGFSYIKTYDDSGNVIEKQVVTGFTDGRNVEISSGTAEGDKAVTEIELSGGDMESRGNTVNNAGNAPAGFPGAAQQ